jgi:hypothetical protein
MAASERALETRLLTSGSSKTRVELAGGLDITMLNIRGVTRHVVASENFIVAVVTLISRGLHRDLKTRLFW